jgi:hypothetical protein
MLVALALLGLSLSHLASGVSIVTGSGERDGWLMVIGIDLCRKRGLRQADGNLVSDAMKADSLHYEVVRIGNNGAAPNKLIDMP